MTKYLMQCIYIAKGLFWFIFAASSPTGRLVLGLWACGKEHISWLMQKRLDWVLVSL